MNAIILFASTFALVFGLGLQSLNVNGGHYRAAFLTSFLIGSMQMITLKLGPDSGWLEFLGYLSGGPLGIIASMKFHKRVRHPKKKRGQIQRRRETQKAPLPPWRNPPPFDIQ